MAYKKHPVSFENPYHVTARTNNGNWFALPMKEMWEIYCDYIYFIHHAYDIKIHSFVLMKNHFHLLATTPQGNLSQAMNYFMRETSRWISNYSKTSNHNYGRRYHRSLISNYHHYQCVYKYIYLNPVRAGVVKNPTKYQYSTLPAKLGLTKLVIPLENDPILFDDDFEQTLKWLETVSHPEHLSLIKKCLKKRVFAIPLDRKNKKPHELTKKLL